MASLAPTKPVVNTLAEILQCPVCYELPIPPIHGCQNGHIICNSCLEHVQHCPVCRAEKFNVRNVIAEEILTSGSLSCPYVDDGCEAPKMTGPQYTEHIKICEFRQIECHCKLGSAECHGQLVKIADYFDHLYEVHGSRTSHINTVKVKCEMDGPFVPTQFSHSGVEFIVMSHKEGPKFWTWVAVDHLENDNPRFYVRLTLRYYCENGGNELVFPSDLFQPVNISATPEQVLKSGRCLEFSAATAPVSMPPYVWPGYIEEVDEEIGFPWGYDVEITQAQTQPRRRVRKVQVIRTKANLPRTVQYNVPAVHPDVDGNGPLAETLERLPNPGGLQIAGENLADAAQRSASNDSQNSASEEEQDEEESDDDDSEDDDDDVTSGEPRGVKRMLSSADPVEPDQNNEQQYGVTQQKVPRGPGMPGNGDEDNNDANGSAPLGSVN